MNPQFSPVVKALESNHGTNFSVHRVELEEFKGLVQPVVGFDHFEMAGPTFAPHPHAGFSAVSYVFDNSPGSLRNRDSLGNDVLVQPGDLLWTQAGSGVIHDEFPGKTGDVVRGLQLFVNLSSRNKGLSPRMLHARRRDIGVHVDEHRNRTKVLTGQFRGVASCIEPAEPFDFFDLTLRGPWTWNVPAGRSMMLYVLEGAVTSRVSHAARELQAHQAVGLRATAAGTQLSIEPKGQAQLLVLSGIDPQEPMVVFGPFILNTQAELVEAFERYRTGQMGRLSPIA